jgi:16S rRNA G527 N7-methylase RsmG
MTKIVITDSRTTLVDVALKHTGSVESVEAIMKLNHISDINARFEPGTQLLISDVVDRRIVAALANVEVIGGDLEDAVSVDFNGDFNNDFPNIPSESFSEDFNDDYN